MATSCRIGVLNDDGSITAIYCHNDGYLDGVGKILLENYTDQYTVDKLLDLGNLSCLGPIPEGDPELWSSYDPDSKKCRTYADRGDRNQDAEVYSDAQDFLDRESTSYYYIYANGEWYYVTHDRDGIYNLRTREKEDLKK